METAERAPQGYYDPTEPDREPEVAPVLADELRPFREPEPEAFMEQEPESEMEQEPEMESEPASEREPERHYNQDVHQEEPVASVAETTSEGSAPTLGRAIELATKVIGELRQVLDEMELVLEYLEDAERQQTIDEREIKILQKKLEGFSRAWPRGQRPEREQPREQRRDDRREPRREDRRDDRREHRRDDRREEQRRDDRREPRRESVPREPVSREPASREPAPREPQD